MNVQQLGYFDGVVALHNKTQDRHSFRHRSLFDPFLISIRSLDLLLGAVWTKKAIFMVGN